MKISTKKNILQVITASSLLFGSFLISEKPIFANQFNINTPKLICSQNRICRKLQAGDKWYPKWRSCCDLGNNRSRWTNSRGRESDWGGSCAYWGISSLPRKQRRICRNLQQGDRWYPGWTRCCDLGNNRSRWTNSRGVRSDWDGSCASWGIR